MNSVCKESKPEGTQLFGTAVHKSRNHVSIVKDCFQYRLLWQLYIVISKGPDKWAVDWVRISDHTTKAIRTPVQESSLSTVFSSLSLPNKVYQSNCQQRRQHKLYSQLVEDSTCSLAVGLKIQKTPGCCKQYQVIIQNLQRLLSS